MAGETVITVVGNLTDDPELRFTPSGAAVANFTVASTPRTLNKQTNEWEDGEAMFLRCSVWRQAAENVAESLQKGARVIVQGRMRRSHLGDPRGREAHLVRDRRRRDRPVPAVGDRQGRQGRPSSGGGGYGASGGGQPAGGDPWATSAAPASRVAAAPRPARRVAAARTPGVLRASAPTSPRSKHDQPTHTRPFRREPGS